MTSCSVHQVRTWTGRKRVDLAVGGNPLGNGWCVVGATNDDDVGSGVGGCIGFESVAAHCGHFVEDLPGHRGEVPDRRVGCVDDGVHAVRVGLGNFADPVKSAAAHAAIISSSVVLVTSIQAR